MRPHGQTKLGFFPLPVPEATRLKHCIASVSEFSALDPCAGDGAAFTHLLHGVTAHRYGIEIDANRAEQARALRIETLQANAMDVRCPPEAVSLLYLNPAALPDNPSVDPVARVDGRGVDSCNSFDARTVAGSVFVFTCLSR